MDIRIISGAFLLGVFSSDTLGLVNILLFTGITVLILFVKAIFTKKVRLMLLTAVIFFAMGATLYKSAYLTEFTDTGIFLGKKTVIEGYICDIPYKQYDMMKYTFNATEINGEKVNEKIIVSSVEEYEFGDSILLMGTLKPINEQMNENGYNMRNYCKGKGITARITAEVSQPCLIDVNRFSPAYAANSLRNKISKLIDEYHTGDYGAILKTVLTGNYHFLSEKLNNLLIRTSTRSLFYPSYIHIMLINICAGAAKSVTKKKWRDIFLAVFFVLYTLINTTHPSFVRGCLFAAAAIGAEHIFKRVYYPGIIAATVLFTCAINPMIAFNSGYVMSVAGTVVIKAFYSPIMDRINIKRHNRAVRALVAHLICVVGTLPLAAYYFNGISPYSVISSGIILPLVAVVIVVSPVFLGLLYFAKNAYAVGRFMNTVTSIMLAVPEITDKLPFSRVLIKTPSLACITAYGAIMAAAAYLIRRKIKYAKRFAVLGIVLASVCAARFVLSFNTLEIDFVNVGQGDGAAVHSTLGANIIIDGGGSAEYSEYNIGERVFVPYLVSIGVTDIDAAFLSHYHKDHTQGVAAAVENLRVRNLYLPSSMPDSKIRAELERIAEEKGTSIHYIEKNTTITFNDGLTVDITVPDSVTRSSDDENDTSLLINVSYGDFNCLFTGDMSCFAEKNLLRKDKVPEADVLKVSHHGSKASLCEEFYERISPTYSVISVGEDNTYGHPNAKTLETIKNSCVFRTDINGDVRIISDKKGNIKTHTLK